MQPIGHRVHAALNLPYYALGGFCSLSFKIPVSSTPNCCPPSLKLTMAPRIIKQDITCPGSDGLALSAFLYCFISSVPWPKLKGMWDFLARYPPDTFENPPHLVLFVFVLCDST